MAQLVPDTASTDSFLTWRTNTNLLAGNSIKNKLDATVDPAVTDDINSGYDINSIWVNLTGVGAFILLDSTVDNAVWQSITASEVAAADLLLSNLTNTATARSNLGVDVTGTDNSTDVSLTTSGTASYLQLVGQVLTQHDLEEADIADLQAYLLNLLEDTTPQLGGDLDTNGKTIDVSSYRQASAATVSSTSTHTFNYANGDMQKVTTSGTITVTIAFSGFPSGKVVTYYVDATNWGSGATIAFAAGVLFADGTAPSYTAAGTDRLCIIKDASDVYSVFLVGADVQ